MKQCIFLAGDSTVQSYGDELAPLTGWGMVLHEFFREENAAGIVPSGSRFSQAVRYETDGLYIDNRAMAGRSSRSFFDEGRLSDIDECIQPGDFLFAQFAHNDANTGKPERFVTPDEYEDYLLKYKEVCDRHQAQFVLVTAIAMRNCDERAQAVTDVWDRPDTCTEMPLQREEQEKGGEGAGWFSVSFPQYRMRCLTMAEKYDIPLLDLGLHTTARLGELGPEESKKLFLWVKPGEYPAYPEGRSDNAHLCLRGAREFAGILAGLVKDYDRDSRLDPVKQWLKP